VRSLFDKYDQDRSGYISKTEMKNLLDDLGLREAVDVVVALIDQDSNGKIVFDEFFSWWEKKEKLDNLTGSRYDILQSAWEMFLKYDTDKSGTLTRDEYISLCKDLGYSSQAETGFATIDTDNSGKINFQEFLNWLRWL